MTETEWNGCTDPFAMVRFLIDSGKATDRKLRLFAAACCRSIWYLLDDERQRRAVEVGERFADGMAGEADLVQAHQYLNSFRHPQAARPVDIAAAKVAWIPSCSVQAGDTFSQVHFVLLGARLAQVCAENSDSTEMNAAPFARLGQAQAQLLRDITGPIPFRPVPLDESWLHWNDGCVVKLATAIYETRRFEEMPILADALEEAGSANPDILEHCRSAGEHVRGCWVLDLLLGRK